MSPDSPHSRGSLLAGFLILIAIVAVTRYPVAPDHLFFFDSINFALALDDFNPALHQPQPPGYPLFVILTRALHYLTGRPETAFLLAGILGAATAVWFLWRLAGFAAALLLLFHPVLIFGGVTNQVRIFYAVIGCGAAWLAMKAWPRDAPKANVLVLGAFIGLGAGFRPDTALLMLPLFLAVLWRHRERTVTVAAATGLYAAGIVAWLLPVVAASGGVENYTALIRQYSQEQFTSSLFYAAPPAQAARMAASAIVWPGLGALTWVLFVPFARLRTVHQRLAPITPILLLWFIPSFLFFALVHVADPDQSLLLVPVYCIAGGAIVESAAVWSRHRIVITTLLAAANFYLFLHAPKGIAQATGYGVIKYINNRSNDVLTNLDTVARQGPLQVLVHNPVLTWRKIAYYTTPIPVYVVDPGPSVWQARSANRQELPKMQGQYNLPAFGNIAIVLPPQEDQLRSRLIKTNGFQEKGAILWRRADPGLNIQIDEAHFAVRSEARP